MGKKTTVQSNEPPAWAKPDILKGLNAATSTYDANQPALQGYATAQQNTYGQVAPGAQQGIMAAQNLVNNNLAGKNLNGNPFLDGMLAKTNAQVTGDVNDQFGTSGRFGSGYHAKILSDSLAAADNQARFNNYGMERGYQQDAIGQSQQLEGGAQSLLNNAADLPYIGVGALNGNVRQASNGYGTNTTTQSGGLGGMLAGIAGAGLSGWASGGMKFSDRRLKTNIEHVGTLPDGLGVYEFDYRDDMPVSLPTERQIGVMADEVARLRPWALATPENGFARVCYEAL